MRRQKTSDGLTVQAISGTYVVLLGIDYQKSKCPGLRGFAVHRTDHEEDEASWLRGMKTFEATDPGLRPGSNHSTREHPVQSFMWSDYSAKPGRKYTYRVLALKGPVDDLQPAAETSISISTEAPEDGINDVYFNRGVAATQEYARRFGNRSPDKIGKAAFEWLSRGLYEAMAAFIEGDERNCEYLVAAYEFYYEPFLQLLRKAADKGAKLRIVYDFRKDVPGKSNAKAATAAGLTSMCKQRKSDKSAISHNKFIVKIRNGEPESVWTGGTNFSEGGIFGHSNVAQVSEDPAVAQAYADYWALLAKDPPSKELRPKLDELTPLPEGRPAKGTTVMFSPRNSLDALDWYAALAAGSEDGLFMTFAFGMNDAFQNVYRTGTAKLRFALLEKATRPMKKGPERDAAEKEIRKLRSMPENEFAIGSHLHDNKLDQWLAERLTNLNKNVRYVHNKFMIIDPLGADPIVVTGSANFSNASTDKNDENMLIVRGDRRVADIYLGEFMRLYTHHAFREWAARQSAPDPEFKHLRTDDSWWSDYFGNTTRSRRRAYFAGV